MPPRPQVDCERHHTTLQVDDIRAAVDFYTTRLGFQLDFLWGERATFAGVTLGSAQIFLEQGTPRPEGVRLVFVVGDADDLFEYHRASGVEVIRKPEDRPYGLREYAVRDLDGHTLQFGHYIYNVGERVPIERVRVPLRLEKRLAALLEDLAAYKHMSLGSLLEEIVLHTCEPFGDGVASPHTSGQLRYIQTLKEKHGIDYDVHASYRFAEET